MERCWWNPVWGVPSWDPPRETDCPNEAEVVLGNNGGWHLCKQCAALPRFKRFKVRRPIRKESDKT